MLALKSELLVDYPRASGWQPSEAEETGGLNSKRHSSRKELQMPDHFTAVRSDWIEQGQLVRHILDEKGSLHSELPAPLHVIVSHVDQLEESML